MYLWRKFAFPRWLHAHNARLQATADGQLVIVERPDRKRVQLEVCCKTAKRALQLRREFGGQLKRFSRDWLERFAREQEGKPVKVGKRLMILRSRQKREANSFPYSDSDRLVIPAGAAFGTGDHETTAMSLRLLEEVSRDWGAHAPPRADCGASPQFPLKQTLRSRGRNRPHARRVRSPELVVDLGTGSGILALAAKRFGAKRVIGIDNDRRAIATARENARLNRIDTVSFRIADIRKWKPPRRTDIVTANLFSELLIEILPRLKGADRLILSGILRTQERDVRRGLRINKIDIVTVRRRGKWIAILANCSGAL